MHFDYSFKSFMFPSNSSVTIWQPLLVRTHQVQWCYYYHCCLHTGSHLAQTVLQLSISQEWSRSFFLINKNFSKNKFIFSFFWNFRSCTLILLTTHTHISAPLPWSSPQRKFKKIKPNKSKAKQTNLVSLVYTEPVHLQFIILLHLFLMPGITDLSHYS